MNQPNIYPKVDIFLCEAIDVIELWQKMLHKLKTKKLDCFICGISRPSNIIIRHKFIQNTVTICPHHTHLFSFISSSINQENLIIAQKIYRLLRYCVTHRYTQYLLDRSTIDHSLLTIHALSNNIARFLSQKA